MSGAGEVCRVAGLARHLVAELQQRAAVRALVPAAQLTTMGVGGSVALLCEPRSTSALCELLATLRSLHVPWRIIGAGSNVVVGDEGYAGAVVRLGSAFDGCSSARDFLSRALERDAERFPDEAPSLPEEEELRLFAYGGTSLMGLSRRTAGWGFSGLEFAAGIPAQLGGAVRMNAGAHGHAMEEVVERALVVTPEGNLVALSKEQLGFSYRHSSIANDMVIVGAELRLRRGDPAEIKERRSGCLDYRRRTQPLHRPSAGSVFTNPEPSPDGAPRFAARLLEEAGLKGRRCGGVSYSPLHANWLVKMDDDAQASQVHELMLLGQSEVERRWGVTLRPEIIFW